MKSHFMRWNRIFLLLALLTTLLPVSATASPARDENTPPTAKNAQSASACSDEACKLSAESNPNVVQPDSDSGENLLRMRTGAFDPTYGELQINPTRRTDLDDAETGLRLVQFSGPILDEWYKALEASGLKIVTYIPDNAYLVWGDGVAVAALEKSTALNWKGVYHPFYALHPALAQTDELPERVKVTVQVYVHSEADNVINKILARTIVIQEPHASLVYKNMTLEIAATDLEWLSALPGVVNVEPALENQKHDEIQGQIIAGNLKEYGKRPSGVGYLTWLNSLGFSTNPADYPIVDVTDDGIDDGDATPLHPDFYEFGSMANPDRLVYNLNGTSDASADGGGGHGNLNAAIVAGYNDNTGYPYEDANGYNYGLGVNPYGRVAGTKVFRNAGAWGYLGTYADIIADSYTGDARISSNSWGSDAGGEYTTASQQYDALARDALSGTGGNQEMIILFSAGNRGSGANTIGAPATAKNVITVGASENYRPLDTDGCGDGPSDANNAQDIAGFSSRGPTDDGRVKPELVAPGTHVTAAASQSANFNGSGVCGAENNDAVAPPTDAYYPVSPAQTLYTWSSGTSHSTPAVAGAASLIYRYYQTNFGGAAPSPAMMKAYLVNATAYMDGVDGNGNLPTDHQGYGLVDLSRAFDYNGVLVQDQTHVFAATNETYSVSGVVADANQQLRVVLAWTDAPGTTIGNAYVNNLDLEVQIGGQTYRGNVFSGATSITGGMADPRNNVESVFLPAGMTGAFTVTVNATNIAGDGVPGNADTTDQDFALVVYNTTHSNNPIGHLVGQVTDGATSAPLPDVQIFTDRAAVQDVTDANGEYHIVAAPGTYTVTVQRFGYQSTSAANIAVVQNTTTTQNFVLNSAPTYVLTGSVTDANTGWPLFASIYIEPDGSYPETTLWTDPWTGEYSTVLMGNHLHTFAVATWSGIAGYGDQSRAINLNADSVENFALVADMGTCSAPGYSGLYLNEGFEFAAFPPEGWVQFRGVNGLGSNNDWMRTTAAYRGSGAAYVQYENVSGGLAQDWLVTPQIHPTAGNNILGFYMHQGYGTEYGSTYTIRVSNNSQTTHTDFDIVQTYGESDFGTSYQQFTVDLSAYIDQDIYVAFVMEQDDGDDWYLDNVGMFQCATPTGGLTAGSVYDANTGNAVNGAMVRNQDGYAQITQAPPGDSAISDGFYVFYSPAGSKTFTATMSGYTPAVVNGLSVVAGETGEQDFFLNVGAPQVAPDALHVTVDAGFSTTSQLVVNNGSAATALNFEIREGAPKGILVVQYDSVAANAMQTALTTLNQEFVGVTTTEFRAMTVDDLSDYNAIFYAGLPDGTSSSGADHTLLINYLDSGGKLYISDNDLGYYHRTADPTAFYGTYLQSTYVADNYGDGVITGMDFMTGLNPDTSADLYPDSFTVGAAGAKLFNTPTDNYAAGAAVARNGYQAVYTSFDFDDIASVDDETELIARVLQHFSVGDVPWLSENPVTGTVPPDGQVEVTVSFDASAVGGPGEYSTNLVFIDDSPYADYVIPVTMTVTPAYVSTGSGNWSDVSHWVGNPATPPTAADNVLIAAGSEITVDIAAACNSLAIADGGRLNLAQTLDVQGVIANNGHLHQEKDVSGASDVDFIMLDDGSGTVKYCGLTVMSGANLGMTAVDIYGNQTYSDGTLPQAVMRKYTVDPINELDVMARFYYRDAELNSNDPATLNIYHYAGNGGWDMMPTAARGGSDDARWVEATIGPAYSLFVLKSPTAPTAVEVAAANARSNILAGFLALAVVSVVVIVKRRK